MTEISPSLALKVHTTLDRIADVLSAPWRAFLAGAVTLGLIVLLPGWLLAVLIITLIAGIAARAFTDPALSPVPPSLTDRAGELVPNGAAVAAPTAGVPLWRAVIDAEPEATLLLDGYETIVHLNAAARDLYPRLRIGMALSGNLRHPELIEAIAAVRSATQPIAVEIIDRVPIERRLAVRITRLEIDPPPARTPLVLIVFRDLTQEDRLSRTRADFVANASHELRTPLAALRGFVETLQGPAKDDSAARARFLDLMAGQALRMSRLIDDLLSLSRIEMKQHVAPRDVIEINAVVADVTATLTPMAAASRTTLDVALLPRPARVIGDRDEILQAIQNLAQNAIKYGRDGGRVGIAITREPGATPLATRLIISVEDDGPGISAEHLPRLTERFYRVSAASSREKGGTGLGLAIVKHIVNRHRGELLIRSDVGKGSAFAIALDEFLTPNSQEP